MTKTLNSKILEISHGSTCPKFEISSQKKFIKLLAKSIGEFEKFLFTYSWGLKLSKSAFENISLNLTLCGDKQIKSINSSYRNKDKVTDVLSFPIQENLRKGDFLRSPLLELGDIYISLPVAKRQAKEFDLPLEYEIIYLFIHGFLHVLGFDHEINAKEEKLMEELEDKLFCKLRKII